MAQNAIDIIIRTVGADAAGKEITGLGNSIGGLDRLAGSAIKALGAAGLAAAVSKFTVDAAYAAAEAERVNTAFINLSGGAKQAAANMAAMQQATRGLASDTEQQAIANQLLGMNIVSTADELEKVVEVSRRLGSTFRGLGAEEAANEFAIMMSNMSVMRLDSFGIASGAVRQRIDELMASTQGMTREQAFFQATMEQADATLARLGPEVDTLATSTQGLSAEWANFTSEFGALIDGPLTEAIPIGTQFVGVLREGAIAWQGIFDNAQTIGSLETAVEGLDSIGLALHDLQLQRNALADAVMVNPAYAGELAEVDRQIAELSNRTAQLLTDRNRLSGATEWATLKESQMARAAYMSAQAADAEAAAIQRGNTAYTDRYTAMAIAAGGTIMHTGSGANQTYIEQQLKALDEFGKETSKVADAISTDLPRSMQDASAGLRSIVEQQMQPTLAEVWNPQGEDQRIDEWGRRAATIMTAGLGSEWIPALKEQFGGADWWQPIQQALENGDVGTAQNLLGNILTSKPELLWDKELIKQNVRDQLQQENARQELVTTIMQELAAEGTTADIGQVNAAMGVGITAQPMIDELNNSLPAALAESNTAGMLLNNIAEQMKAAEKEMLALTQTFAEGFNNYLPTAMGQTAVAFLNTLTAHVADKLGMAATARP